MMIGRHIEQLHVHVYTHILQSHDHTIKLQLVDKCHMTITHLLYDDRQSHMNK